MEAPGIERFRKSTTRAARGLVCGPVLPLLLIGRAGTAGDGTEQGAEHSGRDGLSFRSMRRRSDRIVHWRTVPRSRSIGDIFSDELSQTGLSPPGGRGYRARTSSRADPDFPHRVRSLAHVGACCRARSRTRSARRSSATTTTTSRKCCRCASTIPRASSRCPGRGLAFAPARWGGRGSPTPRE